MTARSAPTTRCPKCGGRMYKNGSHYSLSENRLCNGTRSAGEAAWNSIPLDEQRVDDTDRSRAEHSLDFEGER